MEVATEQMMRVEELEQSFVKKVKTSQQSSLSAPCLALCQRTGSVPKVPILSFQMQISRISLGAD